MSYVSWDHLISRYAELDKSGGAVEVNSSFMASAETQLHGALGSVYTVPFSSNNLTAIDVATDLAYIKIMQTKKPKLISELVKATNKRIEALRNGLEIMVIVGGDTLTPNIAGAVYSNNAPYHNTFGMLPVEEQLIDPDLIEAEIADRD